MQCIIVCDSQTRQENVHDIMFVIFEFNCSSESGTTGRGHATRNEPPRAIHSPTPSRLPSDCSPLPPLPPPHSQTTSLPPHPRSHSPAGRIPLPPHSLSTLPPSPHPPPGRCTSATCVAASAAWRPSCWRCCWHGRRPPTERRAERRRRRSARTAAAAGRRWCSSRWHRCGRSCARS